MDKLKPCPFCGGEAEITQDFVHGWKVMCVDWMNCIAHPSVQIYGEGSRKKAIEAWNKRANPWHTGTPTEEGLYLIATQFITDGKGLKIYRYETDYFNKAGKWRLFTNEVIAWQKITHFEGE